MAATDALRFVGMPRATFPLTQAAVYLAVAPRATPVTTYAAAKADVEEHGACPCRCTCATPARLSADPWVLARSTSTRTNYEGHFVVEDYLPEELQGRHYYQPSNNGRERDIAERWRPCASEEVGRKVAGALQPTELAQFRNPPSGDRDHHQGYAGAEDHAGYEAEQARGPR